jgi:hypothetical protein
MLSRLRATLALGLFLLAASPAGASGTAPQAPLPPAGQIGAWQLAGEPTVWRESGLYGYIDGGAELFLELGFERLTVATYEQGDDEIVVELYRMADPVAALGAFLAHAGPLEPDADLDLHHTVGRYELQARRGDYYLKLQNVRGSAERVEDLLSFAGTIARQIPERPFDDPTEQLPEPGRVPGSTRVVRGPLALESIYSLGPGDILSLEPDRVAVAASYRSKAGDRHARLIVDYEAPDAARAALEHLSGHLDPYLERLERTADRLSFRGYGDDYGLVTRRGERLVLLVGLDEQPEVAPDGSD